jgi:8-oxo-dGTP diphosphatase
MSNTADRSSWKNLPLSSQREKLNIERVFSEEEYSRLSKGLIPEVMEDKWFIFMENNVLYFHRSWTGICIYEVYFDNKRAIKEVWVNRNHEQYKVTDNDHDEKLLMFLINNFLLGQKTSFPVPSNIPSDLSNGVYQHHVSGTGYPEITHQSKTDLKTKIKGIFGKKKEF